MRSCFAFLSLAAVVVAQAQTVTQIDVGSGRYVAGASRDNGTFFVKSDGGQGGGFWSSGGYTNLQAPVGSLDVIEPYKMSSNGQWIVGNAAFERQGYLVYLPVLWNRQGQATVLTEDMSFDNALAVSDDGSTVLMAGLGGGGGTWSNGTITGHAWTQAYDMSADGTTFSYGRDIGPYQIQGVVSGLGGSQQFPTFLPEGGGVSGNGKRIFSFAAPDAFTVQRNWVIDAVPQSYDLTELNLAERGLGARGLVGYDGSVAAWEKGYWRQGFGAKTLGSLGLTSSHLITTVGQDDRHIFLRDTATGNDYVIDVAAVPEPGTMAALTLGGAWLLRRRRRS